MTLQHSSRARGSVEMPDSPLPELSRMEILQAKIEHADRLIALGNLPTVIRLAQDMKARAQAEIQQMVDAEPPTVTQAVSVAYGCWEFGSPEWFEQIKEEPY